MDKLRSTYKKYQHQVYAQKPRYIAAEKVGKYAKLAEKQIEIMQNSNNFSEIQQAVFYKEKFEKLQQTASQYQKKSISDSVYHEEVRATIEKDFTGQRVADRSTIRNRDNSHIDRSNIDRSGGSNRMRQTGGSKSPLKDFFEQQDIKHSKKVTFSNIVAPNDTPLKYGLRSVSRPKNSGPNKNQLRKLQQQNRRLKDQIESSVGGSHLGDDDHRVRQLRDQVRSLDDENRRLRDQVSKTSNAGSQSVIDQEYDPYNLRVRENNITKINSKNLFQSQRMSQVGSGRHNDSFFKSRKSDYHDRVEQSDMGTSDFGGNRKRDFQEQQMLNASQSSIQTQFLNLEQSQLYDQEKNQICRQKIAFFKMSMVLVKQRDYQIAFKRSDFNSSMDKLRLILYVNNKDHNSRACSIDYDYDKQDFDVNVRKRLTHIQGRNQGRQEIQIVMNNANDLGSLITARVIIGDHKRKITVPTLFIDFNQDYKYQFENIGFIERNISKPITIKPMTQFSSIDTASNVLDLNREFEQKYEVAKMYGKSKACKGMVKLTWKSGGKLKIQTCEEWRTLMGYLFLNAEQTIHY